MTRIQSNQNTVTISAQMVTLFLANANNLELLMPAKVINWKSTTTDCSFTIQGTADLSMKQKEVIGNEKVIYEDIDSKPFRFFLTFEIESISAQQSKTLIYFDADLNITLRMLATKPLENFLNILNNNLAEKIEQGIIK